MLKAIERWQKRASTLHQIRYYLRRLLQFMSVGEKFPEVQLWGFDEVIPQLRSVAVSSDGAAALNDREREVVYEALSLCEETIGFISSQRAAYLENPERNREYMTAAARRALRAIRAARTALRDSSVVGWPSDPQTRNAWRVGEPIPVEEDGAEPHDGIDGPEVG